MPLSTVNFNAGKGSMDQARAISLSLDLAADGENVASYPTGGFVLSALMQAEIPPGFVFESMPVKASTTHFAKYDAANKKVLLFADAEMVTEVANTTDMTGTVATLFLIGY